MKRILLVIAACVAMTAGAEARPKRLKIHVAEAGTLSELIAPEAKNSITAMTLSGTLNGADLRFLREMAGSDFESKPTDGRLADIDMAGVSFVAGEEPYIRGSKQNYRIASSRSLPRYIFWKTNIERLVLPTKLDTIGKAACALTRLRSITLPEGVVVDEQAFYGNEQLTEVIFPQYTVALTVAPFRGCTALKRISMNDVGYISAQCFYEMPALETVEINGFLGHADGWNTFCNLPVLKSVDFRGVVLSTGGPKMWVECPELESVTFHDVVRMTSIGEAENSPKTGKYRALKPVLQANRPELFDMPDSLSAEERLVAIETVCQTYTKMRSLGAPEFIEWLFSAQFYGAAADCLVLYDDRATALRYLRFAAEYGKFDAEDLLYNEDFAPLLDDPYVKELTAGFEKPVEGVSRNLMTLRRSPAYGGPERFTYTPPADSLLVRIREHFKVDSIAGAGDEISRIKNIMYWLQNEVGHDGSSGWPDCDFNAIELVELCRREGRGLNCRFMSEVLNDLYLSVGIKSRFLTCQSKKYDSDPDCHVINMVWSESLGKWIWMDASFAAYVADENGLLLHPGEVRERLIDGRPLVLNADANHNHETEVDKEWYLDDYMAKNLYIMSSYVHSTPQSEGPNRRDAGTYITLTPAGFDYRGGATTSDPDYFWQAPRGE